MKKCVHEDFIGLYHCPDIIACTIVSVIKDSLLRLNLHLSQCRGQCSDAASNMAGCKNGIKTQILREEPRGLFTHCYGHAFSLSVGDTIKSIPLLRSNISITHEISKLLQYSSKRLALFNEIKVDSSSDAVGFRILWPSRLTVCNQTCHSIVENYPPVLDL